MYKYFECKWQIKFYYNNLLFIKLSYIKYYLYFSEII